MIKSGSNNAQDSQTDTGLDANNLATVSTALKMEGATIAGLYIIANTGANTTHVITLQVSPDGGTTWINTSHTITGVGELHSITCIADQVRTKVTTAEGGASTVDIIIIIK